MWAKITIDQDKILELKQSCGELAVRSCDGEYFTRVSFSPFETRVMADPDFELIFDLLQLQSKLSAFVIRLPTSGAHFTPTSTFNFLG